MADEISNWQCCDSWKEERTRWRAIPKLELHAHLNGCVRSSTLLELALQQKRHEIEGPLVSIRDLEIIMRKATRPLSDCFKLFPFIHALTTDHAIITRITKEAIEDFAKDNVVYLELRTTPKCNASYGMSKRSYVEAVLAGIEAAGIALSSFEDESDRIFGHEPAHQYIELQEGGKDKLPLYVRLILSIDRKESSEAAMDTVLLALEMRHRGIVGIDLSGDPTVGSWEMFLPALERAKQHGLHVTLHCGEVVNPGEVGAMIEFNPGRVGHVCCLDKSLWEMLLASKIPVEICLTSNLYSQSIPSILKHHYGTLYNAKHPTIICTDDPGLFSTTLSHEFSLAADTFGISDMDFWKMGESAISYTFAEDELKLILREIFQQSHRQLKIGNSIEP